MVMLTYCIVIFKYIKKMSDDFGMPLYKAHKAFIDILQNKRVSDCIMREFCITENFKERGIKYNG